MPAASFPAPAPKRGEVWWADLDPAKGREQAGRRPVLIVSVDPFNDSAADLVTILPMTTRAKGVRSHVRVSAGEAGLLKESFVKCEDVRSISKGRLGERLGLVHRQTMTAVEDRLRFLLGL